MKERNYVDDACKRYKHKEINDKRYMRNFGEEKKSLNGAAKMMLVVYMDYRRKEINKETRSKNKVNVNGKTINKIL